MTVNDMHLTTKPGELAVSMAQSLKRIVDDFPELGPVTQYALRPSSGIFSFQIELGFIEQDDKMRLRYFIKYNRAAAESRSPAGIDEALRHELGHIKEGHFKSSFKALSKAVEDFNGGKIDRHDINRILKQSNRRQSFINIAKRITGIAKQDEFAADAACTKDPAAYAQTHRIRRKKLGLDKELLSLLPFASHPTLTARIWRLEDLAKRRAAAVAPR